MVHSFPRCPRRDPYQSTLVPMLDLLQESFLKFCMVGVNYSKNVNILVHLAQVNNSFEVCGTLESTKDWN